MVQALAQQQQVETMRVRGQSLPSIPEGSKQSMNFEAVINIQKQNQEKESKEGIQLSTSLLDEQNDKVYLKDIAKINKDIKKIKSKAKMK
jgi:multidrug efflux pump subunit AcrB